MKKKHAQEAKPKDLVAKSDGTPEKLSKFGKRKMKKEQEAKQTSAQARDEEALTIDLLLQVGIDPEDVNKLHDAGFHTINRLITTKEGLNGELADKISHAIAEFMRRLEVVVQRYVELSVKTLDVFARDADPATKKVFATMSTCMREYKSQPEILSCVDKELALLPPNSSVGVTCGSVLLNDNNKEEYKLYMCYVRLLKDQQVTAQKAVDQKDAEEKAASQMQDQQVAVNQKAAEAAARIVYQTQVTKTKKEEIKMKVKEAVVDEEVDESSIDLLVRFGASEEQVDKLKEAEIHTVSQLITTTEDLNDNILQAKAAFLSQLKSNAEKFVRDCIVTLDNKAKDFPHNKSAFAAMSSSLSLYKSVPEILALVPSSAQDQCSGVLHRVSCPSYIRYVRVLKYQQEQAAEKEKAEAEAALEKKKAAEKEKAEKAALERADAVQKREDAVQKVVDNIQSILQDIKERCIKEVIHVLTES